jgi:hypothetical protein
MTVWSDNVRDLVPALRARAGSAEVERKLPKAPSWFI